VTKYSGKKKILGTEKVHATLTYKQNVIRIPQKIFNIFKTKYELQKDML
jgi:hypothetical protein